MVEHSATGLARMWWLHIGFIGLYAAVAATRWSTERVGHAFFTSAWVDLLVSLPATVAVVYLWRRPPPRLGPGGRLLLHLSLAELPALVGLVGFLAGGELPWLVAHLGASLVLMTLPARPA